MTQSTANVVIGLIAVLWPILVTALDRAYGHGKTDERLKNIEKDVKEIRDLFVLTPRGPSAN